MVRRRGLGATLVASALFSVVLLAGLSVYVASEDRAGLYSTADAESFLGDEFQVLAAAGGANILLAAQNWLGSHSLDCSSAPSAVAQEVGSLSDLQSYGGLTVAAQGGAAADLSAVDNMSALYPFNGSVAGDLDLSIRFAASGSAGVGATFERTEVHAAHLGVHLEDAATLCLEALSAVDRAIQGLGPTDCAVAAVGQPIKEAFHGPESAAAALGFSAGLSYSVSGASTCTVTFKVTLVQSGVLGPGGPFSAQFAQEGSASFAATA